MSYTIRKFMHYAVRSAAAFISWLALTMALMCIPSFTDVSGDSVTVTSPVPILIPLGVAAVVFFLIKKPLNNSNHFYNPDAFLSHTSSSYIHPQNSSVEIELMAIDLMEGLDFEYWCADLLTKMGYTNVEVTRGSGDQGVDVLAQKDGIKYAIQCKCYSSNLGNTPVQEINTGKVIYHCHVGVVMTNRYFTEGAKEAAEATGVLLWDRDWIADGLKATGRTTEKSSSETPADSPINTGMPYTEDNKLFCAAVDAIMDSHQATVAVIQRNLKLSYVQAAKLMDKIELRGIVGPFQGNTPREILITEAQWKNMRTRFQ